MQTTHDDKNALRRLSAAGRALFQRKTAPLGLSFDEQAEIGYQVAVAAENASTPAWFGGMRQAAEATEAEAAELAAAEVELAAAIDRREKARTKAFEAERDYHTAQAVYGHDFGSRDATRRIDEAEHGIAVAESALRLATYDVEPYEMRARRARVAILRNGLARQTAVVGRL